MRSDGSFKDEFPSSDVKRYAPDGEEHAKITTPIVFERIFEGSIIRFGRLFTHDLVCLTDVRDATGYNCHCNSEGKASTICICNKLRSVDINEFKENSSKVYPNVEKKPTGARFLKWVRDGYPDSPRRMERPEWFTRTKDKTKEAASDTINRINRDALNGLVTILIGAINAPGSSTLYKKLTDLLLELVKASENVIVDKTITERVAKELSVDTKTLIKKEVYGETKFFTAQEYTSEVGIYCHLQALYPKTSAMKKDFWSTLGKLLTAEAKARGYEIRKVPISKCKIEGWDYEGGTINSYPEPLLKKVFLREFRIAQGKKK